jgi:hypothetical protein
MSLHGAVTSHVDFDFMGTATTIHAVQLSLAICTETGFQPVVAAELWG